jgi:hypothetical protein
MAKSGKKPQRKISLPAGWWDELRALAKRRWHHEEPGVESDFDFYVFVGITRKTFDEARRDGHMTEQRMLDLAEALGYERIDDLVLALGNAPPLATAVGGDFRLTQHQKRAGWLDGRELAWEERPISRITCRFQTAAAYFRFGIKLVTRKGRPFSETRVETSDEELLFHIGRGSMQPHVSRRHLFLSCYQDGARVDRDEPLFAAKQKVDCAIDVRIQDGHAHFLVDNRSYKTLPVTEDVCRRALVLFWGDGAEVSAEISALTVERK